ncbi:MAG TPA: hypothetical protein VFM55_04435 [Micromonosporaceae bacterium]|nr:hypothetical protein [Micromonosporaceae bacterium]
MLADGTWLSVLVNPKIRGARRERILAAARTGQQLDRAVEATDQDPDRISFTRALRVARQTATGTAGVPPGDWTGALPAVHAEITGKLNPPRRHRSCPRPVKRARHNSYRVKKPGEATSTRHHGPATIRFRGSNPHHRRTDHPTTKDSQQHPSAAPAATPRHHHHPAPTSPPQHTRRHPTRVQMTSPPK